MRMISAGVVIFLGCALLLAESPLNLKNMDLEAIDSSCKPCDDFYQFAMGKWFAAHPIPANQTRWGKRWAGADGNLDVLKSITEELAAGSFKPGTNERLVADLYASCADTSTIDALGVKPIAPALKRVADITDRRGLQLEIVNLQRDSPSVSAGFRFTSRPDSDDPRQVIVQITPAPLGLPDRDYYLKDDAKSKATRERYRQHIETLLKLAGLSSNNGADRILAMETSFAREQLSRVERRDPYKTNTHLTSSTLEGLMPHFDWAHYYRTTGVKFEGTANVVDPKYIKELNRQLQETSLEDWRLLLSWNVIRASASDLSAPFRQEAYEFHDRFLGGQNEQAPRWKYCIERTDALLGEALGKVYVERVFPPAAKAKMQEMAKFIMAAMKDSILGLDWMSQETKQKALAKLATIDPKVGYPDKWRSYAGVAIARGDYFGSVRNAQRLNQDFELAQIGKPVDRTLWRMTTPTSNAYYNPLLNEIVFPAGILVPPMFSADAEDAVNYGAIGVVIGHEISHGFDDQGSQFDADGRLKSWWTPEDRKRFTARTDCVVDQFANYFIEPGVAHNGKLVLGESIGDLAGARIAYLAYMKSLEGKKRPPVIAGFTPEQRFFLSWGQARGDSIRLEQQRRMGITDPHPTAKFRVIGPLSNMPEFQKAFGCKAGDAMVRPAEKACRIW